jgi:putative FmdB family regulatory protein
MPIYEFRCEECGAEFEQLTEAGALVSCPECGSERTKRIYSPQAAPFSLVKTPGAARKQEGRNAKLRERTKARFKESRQRARERAAGRKEQP